MSWVDLVIVSVIGISVIVSLFRGLIQEVFSLLVWIGAVWLALQFAGSLAEGLEPWVDLPSARVIIAFVGIFLVVLVTGALVNYLLGRLVKSTGLSGTDRLAGGLFGALRGIVLVLVAVVIAGFTPFPEDPWWQESRLLPEFERLGQWAMQYMPESIQEYLVVPDEMTEMESS